jgi:hypothetical protein
LTSTEPATGGWTSATEIPENLQYELRITDVELRTFCDTFTALGIPHPLLPQNPKTPRLAYQ